MGRRPPLAGSTLPSAAALQAAEGKGRDLFPDLRDWVRQQRRERSLDEAGAALDSDHRRFLFNFLCQFAAQRTVFRLQARDLLKRLAASEAWRQGDAVDDEAVAAALADCFLDGSEVASKESSREPSEELSSNLSSENDSREEEPQQMPPLPSESTLRDHRSDRDEILAQLCEWVGAAKRRRRLRDEATELDGKHRQAVTAFLIRRVPCTAASQQRPQTPPRRRRFSMPSLPRGVYGSRSSSQGGNLRKASVPADEVTPEQYYVLQAIAEVSEVWFEGQGYFDRSLLSRALAQKPCDLREVAPVQIVRVGKTLPDCQGARRSLPSNEATNLLG